jgi:Tetracyclin repressor-like, C-terminal domain
MPAARPRPMYPAVDSPRCELWGLPLHDEHVGSRRRLVGAIRERGVARGELAPDVEQDVAIDLVFGPAMYRLVARHAPLDEAAADQIVDTAMLGLSAR